MIVPPRLRARDSQQIRGERLPRVEEVCPIPTGVLRPVAGPCHQSHSEARQQSVPPDSATVTALLLAIGVRRSVPVQYVTGGLVDR